MAGHVLQVMNDEAKSFHMYIDI